MPIMGHPNSSLHGFNNHALALSDVKVLSQVYWTLLDNTKHTTNVLNFHNIEFEEDWGS